ncbi:hypothetical protein SLA2020_395680 [Shorea laevis]
MRFQRVSPDCPPLSKSNSKPIATMCKEDDSSNGNINNGRSILKDSLNCPNTSTGFEGTKGFRFRSPSRTQDHSNSLSHSGSGGVPNSPPQTQVDSHHHEIPKNPQPSQRGDGSPSPSPNRGNVLLQWGQKKRTRVSRSEIRAVTDDSSSSSILGRQVMGNKVQRRTIHAAMPPPPPAPHNSRSSNLRNGSISSKETSGFIGNRNLEDRSAAANGSPSRNSGGNSRSVSRSTAGKRSPPPETTDRKKSCSGSVKDEKQSGSVGVADRLNHVASAAVQSGQDIGAINAALVGGEKVNEVIEWPRIYVALSRKEKEDDFLAMKGTKLPQRPKKRAKHIDRTLQYCFPGMWLSDLTKSRYEVREKKSVKKQRRRGLKGMESLDSDSD